MMNPKQLGPFPILGDHLEQRFLVRVELSIGLGGRIESPDELLKALAGNFADLVATYEATGDLVGEIEIVSCEDKEPSGLPPAPGDCTLEWTDEDARRSEGQGWSIFQYDGDLELQRLDDPDEGVREFKDDAVAARFVKKAAKDGDATCRKAIELLIFYKSPDVQQFKLKVTWKSED